MHLNRVGEVVFSGKAQHFMMRTVGEKKRASEVERSGSIEGIQQQGLMQLEAASRRQDRCQSCLDLA